VDGENDTHNRGAGGNFDVWGIFDEYTDNFGHLRRTSPETREALIAAMGGEPEDSAPPARPPVMVVRRGETADLPSPAELTLESGARVEVRRRLPPDVPLGYHELRWIEDEGQTRLIVCPDACLLDPKMHVWGWAVQLYAARSEHSWGIGDLADLRRLARWSARQDAGMLMVNPLSAVAPVLPQERSPYYPTSRRFRNPLYLRVEEVPGAAAAELDLEILAAAGRQLNGQRRIDRDRVFRRKLEALELLWAHWRETNDPAFDGYCQEQGESLKTFSVFCALAERFQDGDWRRWQPEYRHPSSGDVRRFAQKYADRVRFHQWLQWLLDVQLARAAAELALVQDLPIGVDPGGADAWGWQDILASGASVGAPPDQFNSNGQDWCFSPFIPHRLKAAGYQPFIETIRAALGHAHGLLIDHVMGLYRLLWIPRGSAPPDGAYVRYPFEDLLAILALESHRAGAWVVGEDLGTVPREVREQLARHRVLSYRLLWFEGNAPAEYPAQALAAITTHDLPTVAGLWSGADVSARRSAGLPNDEDGWKHIRDRLASKTGLPSDAPVAEVIQRAYELLARAPSAVRVASLNDALAVEERPNMPGTLHEWPNWSIALPEPLEALERASLPRSIAASLSRPAHGPRAK
jgi:4-alpha-glucanotransferase